MCINDNINNDNDNVYDYSMYSMAIMIMILTMADITMMMIRRCPPGSGLIYWIFIGDGDVVDVGIVFIVVVVLYWYFIVNWCAMRINLLRCTLNANLAMTLVVILPLMMIWWWYIVLLLIFYITCIDMILCGIVIVLLYLRYWRYYCGIVAVLPDIGELWYVKMTWRGKVRQIASAFQRTWQYIQP